MAHLGDGSMRDSLSILDQCLAFFSGEEVTLEKVLDIMGAVDQTIFFEMTDALAKRDAKEAMLLVEQMMQDGRDVKQFVTELLQHLRNLLMAATLPDVTRILDLSAEDGERLKKAAGVLSPEELIYFIGKFSDLRAMDGEGFDCPGGKTGRAGAEDGRRRAGCHHAGGTDRKAEGKAQAQAQTSCTARGQEGSTGEMGVAAK